MDISKATARPWNLGDDNVWILCTDGSMVAELMFSDQTAEQDKANAALIVQAVNSYEPLLEIARKLAMIADEFEHVKGSDADGTGIWSNTKGLKITIADCRKARAAIKIAEGKP